MSASYGYKSYIPHLCTNAEMRYIRFSYLCVINDISSHLCVINDISYLCVINDIFLKISLSSSEIKIRTCIRSQTLQGHGFCLCYFKNIQSNAWNVAGAQ